MRASKQHPSHLTPVPKPHLLGMPQSASSSFTRTYVGHATDATIGPSLLAFLPPPALAHATSPRFSSASDLGPDNGRGSILLGLCLLRSAQRPFSRPQGAANSRNRRLLEAGIVAVRTYFSHAVHVQEGCWIAGIFVKMKDNDCWALHESVRSADTTRPFLAVRLFGQAKHASLLRSSATCLRYQATAGLPISVLLAVCGGELYISIR